MSEYQGAVAMYRQRIEQLESSNRTAEEYMNRTIAARLAEMEAYMQKEKERVVSELMSERDNAVRQAETAYRVRLDAMREEATQWFGELQKNATEVIENARKAAEDAQRDNNLAKQREPRLEREIASLWEKLDSASVHTMPEPTIGRDNPDVRFHRTADRDLVASTFNNSSSHKQNLGFPQGGYPATTGARMRDDVCPQRQSTIPMADKRSARPEPGSTTSHSNLRRSERLSEPVSSRRRGKRRVQSESKSDSDTDQEGFGDTEANDTNERKSRMQRHKSTEFALAARMQRQRDALMEEEVTKLESQVCELVKKVWKLSRDTDIRSQKVACAADSQAYEDGTGEGPDTEVPRLCMRGSMSSKWNRAVCRSLLEIFKKGYMRKVAFASEELVLDTIMRKCTMLWNAWREMPSKSHAGGQVETLDEDDDRAKEDAHEEEKSARQAVRRLVVSGL
ncbi:hypothetical protein BDY19DRAFT_910748 [Irpex rosettiformis]|uniref:Uncharacterized protein n=1 Tax=Irpex rosettiformis TaxID=378272 RepID=A0ACB8TMM0_9APHY|nr:hypothetical protein BDY19DRAFT_910748 [Irpex rosettiformis]